MPKFLEIKTLKKKELLIIYKILLCSVNNMGEGLIEVLKKAESGSLWVIEFDQPARRLDFIVEKYNN